MIQLHPPLSGFPLSCIVLLVVVEVFSILGRSSDRVEWARRFLVFAVLLATTAAFLSGYQASSPLSEAPSPIQDALGLHHAVGRIMLINSILLAAFALVASRALHGKRVIQSLYHLTVVIQLGLALWVGSLGGSLVFDHAVGVRKPTAETATAAR